MSKQKFISKLKQTSNIEEVNQHLQDGWQLIEVGFHVDNFHYLLGKVDKKALGATRATDAQEIADMIFGPETTYRPREST